MQPDMRKKSSKDLLARIRDRYKVMYDADHENRLQAMEDLKFALEPGYQWDQNMKQERGQRPCYEFNKIRPIGKRVINDMRANRPQGKVRAVENGDVEIAEINEGLCRNIWNCSDADSVVDHAAEYQVYGGMGAWRITTDYADDSMFDQDICIEAIQNPFCLYCDPNAEDFLKRDADDWILTDRISHKEFESRYGKKTEKSDFEADEDFDDQDWYDEKTVRIAEYWYKEPHKKELWQLEDGTVVDSESDEARGIPEEAIKRRREVQTHKIYSCIASGAKILEGPTEWPSSEFPFVMIYGEHVCLDGRPRWWGLTRFAKDAQKEYNITRTAIAETIHQSPKTQFWATVEQAKGLTDQWATAQAKNFPFMLYNPDEKSPGPPMRMGGPDVPIALVQEAAMASDDLKAITGIFDASMGNRSNESSGRAIYARQQQGEIVTFNYMDNLSKGIKRTYEIILSLIPHVYDTERELRVIGSDGAEDYKRVNQVVFDPVEGRAVRINDITTGKYDVTVTVGPSFATLRQEAAETWSNLGNQMPELWQVAGDLIMKSMDLPYADDIADRLRHLLPPAIQQSLDQGKEIPPEAQMAMEQANQVMAQAQEYGQLVQQAAGELEEMKAANAQDKAEIKALKSDLQAKEAEFRAEIAEKMAELTIREAELKVKGADIKSSAADLKEQFANTAVEMAGENDALPDAVASIDATVAEFMQFAMQVMAQLEAKASQIQTRQNRKIIGGATRRDGGEVVADVEYDDGSRRTLRAVRDKGQLRLVPEPDSGATEA